MGEMVKRALKWPKHFSNTAAQVALDLQSAKSHVLQRKLVFLRRLLVSDSIEVNRVAVATMKSLADQPQSIC